MVPPAADGDLRRHYGQRVAHERVEDATRHGIPDQPEHGSVTGPGVLVEQHTLKPGRFGRRERAPPVRDPRRLGGGVRERRDYAPQHHLARLNPLAAVPDRNEPVGRVRGLGRRVPRQGGLHRETCSSSRRPSRDVVGWQRRGKQGVNLRVVSAGLADWPRRARVAVHRYDVKPPPELRQPTVDGVDHHKVHGVPHSAEIADNGADEGAFLVRGHLRSSR